MKEEIKSISRSLNMNSYEMLPKGSFPKICRTCLIHSELFLIHEVNWEDISLMKILKDWTSLELDNEQLPQNMCKDCIKSMFQTYNFLSKCEQSQIILRNILYKELTRSVEETVQLERTTETTVENMETVESKISDADNIGGDGIFDNDQYIEENLIEDEDNGSQIDDPAEIKSDSSCNGDQTEGTVPTDNILNKIQCIKNQISKIRVKNKVRLRQMAKAQLMGYCGNLPKTNKRAYVIRKGPPFTCVTCDASYQTHEELKKHKIETKHKKSLKFKCQYCQRKYDAYCKYEEHVRTHTGEKPNKCTTCGKCFNFKTDLKRHMVMHMEVKPYSCRFCSKGFTRKQYLRDHERKHTGEKLLCPFCGKGFHSYSTLSYHEKAHKGPPGCVRDPQSKDRLFQCHICDKVLLTDNTLKAHILLHGPKNFSCEICGKTFISKNRLQDHIRLTHQGIRYSCHLCDKEYKQKSGLEFHMKSHTGQNNYPCETCGKQFACKGSLYQHKRVHTGDTKYQCKECFHICINKRNLENHMRIHTGEKPFACVYCGKLFAQKVNMMAHSKIHTGEKNHICKLCDKAFYDTRGLKKHVAIHVKNGENENIV